MDSSIETYKSIIVALSVGMGLMVIGYLPILHWVYRSKKQEYWKHKKQVEQAQDMLYDAEKTAKELIETTETNLSDQLKTITTNNSTMKSQFEQDLEDMVKKWKAEFLKTSEELKIAYLHKAGETQKVEEESIRNMENEVKTNTSKAINNAVQNISDRIEEYSKEYQSSIKNIDDKISESLLLFEEAQKERIRKKIYTIVTQVSMDMIGEGLTQHQHKVLIDKSLQEAFGEVATK